LDRRKFLKQSALFSVGGLFIPSAFISSFKNDTESFHGKVVVVGAGASGLYAGYILKEKGIDVEILEAGSNYGGRLAKLEGFASFPIDLGAQWLHGKNNMLGKLIAETNTKITIDKSDVVYWFNNKLSKKLPKKIDIFEGKNLPDISFKDYALKKGLGNEYQYIVESLAGDYGAAASRLSVYYTNLEEENWNSGDDDFKFEETYFDLIDKQIAYKVKDNIRLNTVVSKIDYSTDKMVITDSKRNEYIADKIILTVPISILKSNDIQFFPELPVEKTHAFSKIGMDAGIKVFLKFSHKFYHPNIIGGAVCATYFDDSIGKRQHDNILTAFVIGEQAENLGALMDENEIISSLLQELDLMYEGQASKYFMAAHVQNWTHNPYIKGAYSYSTINMGDARKIAAQSVDKKLYFAGEAMSLNGNHQTVHGAVETGYSVVRNLLDELKK
jgi:monoamine oxidase